MVYEISSGFVKCIATRKLKVTGALPQVQMGEVPHTLKLGLVGAQATHSQRLRITTLLFFLGRT